MREYAAVSANVLSEGERFWQNPRAATGAHEMLRFSFFMGLFPFSGYLFLYTVTGRVWNDWPFINTTLPVLRGLMCAGLQWVFFATFPTISTLILEFLFSRKSGRLDPARLTFVCTYSMVPMHLAALFLGALLLHRTTTVLGLSAFLYLLFTGYRSCLRLGVWTAGAMTLLVALLFAMIRQMFVFVIGF